MIIGKAFAGHAARIGDKNNPVLAAKSKKYDNPLSDMVMLIIAEQSLKVDASNIVNKKQIVYQQK